MRVLGTDCEFDGFTCRKWLEIGVPDLFWESPSDHFDESPTINAKPSFPLWHPAKALTIMAVITINKANPDAAAQASFNAAEHQLCTHTGNTDSLLNECDAHEYWLKWEMKARCGAQSPGLEISIWVTATNTCLIVSNRNTFWSHESLHQQGASEFHFPACVVAL